MNNLPKPIWKPVTELVPFCPECGAKMIASMHPHWAEYDWVCTKCDAKCKGKEIDTGVRGTLDVFESMSDKIKPYEKAFFGGITGILLRKRGSNDPHIIFEIIYEDDGYWFAARESHNNSTSSSWFSDYLLVLTEAIKWCEKNCDPDIVEESGIQYGWKFRDIF